MPTPGYSGKPLGVKLGLKPGTSVCVMNEPADMPSFLDLAEYDVQVCKLDAGHLDFVLLFAMRADQLQIDFAAAANAIATAGMVWVAWPKKSARSDTDLVENTVRDIGLAAGLVDVKVCAVSDFWSGLKFLRRLKDR